MGRMVCTEPQCLYKGDLYLYYFTSWSLHTFGREYGNLVTGQQRFYPKRKKVVSDVFLDAEFECFQNFSITHTFKSRIKFRNFLRQDNIACF